MAPVTCVLAVPLALGLVRLGGSLAYRWTVTLLLILTTLITFTLWSDWRREVQPYRHMLTPQTDFARDLPAGPSPGDAPVARPRGLEIARGAILLTMVGFWAWICTRLRPTAAQPEARWRAIRNVHFAWWGSLAVGSGLLRALG